jgi:hypothetical protein
MTENPFLKVFVANGYYDLATPFAATRYTFGRIGFDPEIRKNLSVDYFEAGHMMYIDRRAHAKLKKDLARLHPELGRTLALGCPSSCSAIPMIACRIRSRSATRRK